MLSCQSTLTSHLTFSDIGQTIVGWNNMSSCYSKSLGYFTATTAPPCTYAVENPSHLLCHWRTLVPRPFPPPVFAHCKQPNTGDGNGLGIGLSNNSILLQYRNNVLLQLSYCMIFRMAIISQYAKYINILQSKLSTLLTFLAWQQRTDPFVPNWGHLYTSEE